MTSPFLDNYEPLDVIGNGSFGIIRKVRRKTDGLIFARKELNFERMSDRDRKQIVAEVNILKDLHHDHIVRYHDRYVDRDAGILYILMEYCGGGDLSTIIKQATKQNRPIPEDTIWHYFLQILQALHHCHHPNGHSRSGSGSTIHGGPIDAEGGSRRVQILHRDLKPDNVFLDENNTVKLGDFGLSKALAQASFANTYVGTPYYMSPELMQEKAYDSKSDIWSLGCLIYELCALKPPFHEAKTHSELSIFIRNGRIPPLPRGYSQALTSVIKSMLNLNPAMRPSAAQLLQHERLELFNRLADAEKMFSVVKAHRATVTAKEREILAREQSLLQNEQRLTSLLNQKDQEITSLQQLVSQLQQQQLSRHDVEVAVKQAVARREEELRVLVMKREEEVAVAIAKREEEIMEAVRNREAEVDAACVQREELIRKEVDERIQWVLARENELKAEEMRLEDVKRELEESAKKAQQQSAATTTTTKGRKEKSPLEEVKNLLEPMTRTAQVTPIQHPRRRKLEPTCQPTPSTYHIVSMETPVSRPIQMDYMPSAMKGVVLTSTGEILATPAPAELVNLFNRSPKVGLNFGKIFDFEEGDSGEKETQERHEDGAASPPPSPSSRKEREKAKDKDKDKDDASSENSTSSSGTSAANTRKQQALAAAPPPTRIRRPSIRSSHRASRSQPATLPSSTSDPAGLNINGNGASTSNGHSQAKPLPHPHLRPSGSSSNLAAAAAAARSLPIPVPRSHPSPEYDFADEENLPSPFLKRVDKAAAVKVAAAAAASSSIPNPSNVSPISGPNSSSKGPQSIDGGSGPGSSSSSSKVRRRGSSGLLLRAVAAANNTRRGTPSTSSSTSVAPPNGNSIGMEGEGEMMTSSSSTGEVGGIDARPSLASARKASEQARQALLRP